MPTMAVGLVGGIDYVGGAQAIILSAVNAASLFTVREKALAVLPRRRKLPVSVGALVGSSRKIV